MRIIGAAYVAFLALGLLLSPPVPVPGRAEVLAASDGRGDRYLVEWSVKLTYRGRYLFRKVGIDQWSGARILMRRTRDASGRDLFSMERPLEDPWVFRWYPYKDELKLGATVSVAQHEIVGDPYGELALRLEPIAQDLSNRWLDDPFWSPCRTREVQKPRLSSPSTYPFYALGSPADRLRFQVDLDGGIERGQGWERMSGPWLPEGWTQAIGGNMQVGTGFWGSERPDWEPRGYPALFRSLSWLEAIDPTSGKTGIDLARLAEVVEILNPQVEGRLGWSGRVEWSGTDSGARTVDGGAIQARLHRARSGTTDEPTDEFFAALVDRNDACRLRLEVRLAYSPYSAGTSGTAIELSSPATNARISSRTRR